MNVRLPEVRRALLREVTVLASSDAEVDEVALDDAVEEVWHVLDPSITREPGDILLSEEELALASELWRALSHAQWPIHPQARRGDPRWADVVRGAAAFMAETG